MRSDTSYFCTLFDHRYVGRALAMYSSLKAHLPNSIIYCLPMDTAAENILHQLNLPGIVNLPFQSFLDKNSLEVLRETRPWNEFCFTCTPFLIDYCLKEFTLPFCTYLDADIYFFDSPEHLLNELKPHEDVLITEHGYAPGQDQSSTSGRFCVQFVGFRNAPEGLRLLQRWKAQCFESCAMDSSNNLCGDQKYLDEWPSLSSTVHIARHQGAVGPWGIEKFHPTVNSENRILISSQETLVFYHFHGLKFFTDLSCELTGSRYGISKATFQLIYLPYILDLFQIRYQSWLQGIPGNFLSFASKTQARNKAKEIFRNFILRDRNFIFSLKNYLPITEVQISDIQKARP